MAFAKALVREKEENERNRIKAALQSVERKAAESRIRSSPSARAARTSGSPKTNLGRRFEEQAGSRGATQSVNLRASSPAAGDCTLGSIPPSLAAPIPQSPLSEITNCIASNPEIASNSSTCAVKSVGAGSTKRRNGNGNPPRTPDRLVREPTLRTQSEPCAQRPCPKPLDPRREWELAPLKEALARFVQSAEVFQRPSASFRPPACVRSTLSAESIPILKASVGKHSIMPLLQLYVEKETTDESKLGSEKAAPNEGKVAAQTQTDSTVEVDEHRPRHAVKSIWSASTTSYTSSDVDEEEMWSGDDRGDSARKSTIDDLTHDGSFSSENLESVRRGGSGWSCNSQPSHQSGEAKKAGSGISLDIPSRQDQACQSTGSYGADIELKPTEGSKAGASASSCLSEYDESFPSYDSTHRGQSHASSRSSAVDARSVAETVVHPVEGEAEPVCAAPQRKTGGCAWVFDFNGDGAGDDRSMEKDEKSTPDKTVRCEEAMRRAITSQDESSSSADDDDQYDDSTFISETVTQCQV